MTDVQDAMSTPLFDTVGVVDLSARGKLELSGDDAVGLLHKFCTNDVHNLAVDVGCEAFVLDAKGHVQFYVVVHRRADRLVLECLSGVDERDDAARLLKFLDRYVIREKVKFVDRTQEWGELLIAGRAAREVLADALKIAPPSERLRAVSVAELGDTAFVASGGQAATTNYTLFAPRERIDEVVARLTAAGAAAATLGDYEAARIDAGLPLLGPDIKPKALAQELDRVEQTINFRKGCYLGQETVARLDALGHVNKTLVRLAFAADAKPTPAMELRMGEQVVGNITSVAAPRGGAVAALAIVRTGANQPGKVLEAAAGPAAVLPRLK